MRIKLFTLILILGAGLAGYAERRKSDPGPHPIHVLKVVVDNTGRDMAGTRGVVHIWIHNAADVAVDKCKVEVDLYNSSGRMVDKLTQEIGTLDPGKKAMKDIKWYIPGETDLKPRIWLFYNGGLDRLTQFESDVQQY